MRFYLVRCSRSFIQDNQVPLHRAHHEPPEEGVDMAILLCQCLTCDSVAYEQTVDITY